MYCKVFMAYLPKGVSQSWLKRAKAKVKANHRKVMKKRNCVVFYNEEYKLVEIIAPPIYTTLPTSRWL